MRQATRSSAGAPEVLSLRMSWSPSLAGLGGEVSPGAGIKRFFKNKSLGCAGWEEGICAHQFYLRNFKRH